MKLITACLSAALLATAISPVALAQIAGDARSVQTELRKASTELDRARGQLSRHRGTPCATEIAPSINDVTGDLADTVDGRLLERVRTELKWMARFSSHVCSAKVTASLTKAHVHAERAMMAYDLEDVRIRQEQEAAWAAEDAAVAAAERARLAAQELALRKARQAQALKARASIDAANALAAEKANCWKQSDPGCGVHRDGKRAMNNAEFTAFIKGVEDAWSSDRITFITGHKSAYFTTLQLGEIIEQLSASQHLTVVQALAARIIDPENFGSIQKKFWASDRSKVIKILSSQNPVR